MFLTKSARNHSWYKGENTDFVFIFDAKRGRVVLQNPLYQPRPSQYVLHGVYAVCAVYGFFVAVVDMPKIFSLD
jgi:hypothetical protein